MKNIWCDRRLIVGPYVGLVTSEKAYNAAMRHCKQDPSQCNWIKSPQADATTHTITMAGKLVCIVAIRYKEDVTGIQIASMLVHEAVHIWQYFKDWIGETHPSMEFEAYSIQCLSQELMIAYSKTLK